MAQTIEKESKIQHFHFVIEGEFITEMARSWFWDENRPYEEVEEFVMNCLISDRITDDERIQLAQMIIEGKKKLVGNSDDGLFIEDDNKYIRPAQLKIQSKELRTEYGLCDPKGNWYPCEFGEHNIKALELIKKYPERFHDVNPDQLCKQVNIFQDSEALDIVLKAGWCVLRYDASRGYYLDTPMSIGIGKNLTKAQKDMVWDIIVKYDIHMDTDELL